MAESLLLYAISRIMNSIFLNFYSLLQKHCKLVFCTMLENIHIMCSVIRKLLYNFLDKKFWILTHMSVSFMLYHYLFNIQNYLIT